jgi:hypothetical protein
MPASESCAGLRLRATIYLLNQDQKPSDAFDGKTACSTTAILFEFIAGYQ